MRTVIVDGWPPEPRLQFDIYVVTTGWHCMCVCVCVCVCSAFLIASWWTSLRSTPSYRSHPPQYAPNASARSRSAVQNAPRSLAPHYLIFEYGTKNKETDRSTGGKTVWVGSTRPPRRSRPTSARRAIPFVADRWFDGRRHEDGRPRCEWRRLMLRRRNGPQRWGGMC